MEFLVIVTKIACKNCGDDLVRREHEGQLQCIQCDGLLFLAFHKKSEEVARFRNKLGTLKNATRFDNIIEELAEDFNSIMN